jgi:hypothetical protein
VVTLQNGDLDGALGLMKVKEDLFPEVNKDTVNARDFHNMDAVLERNALFGDGTVEDCSVTLSVYTFAHIWLTNLKKKKGLLGQLERLGAFYHRG